MDIDVGGLTIHYASFGEGRPILMLHGWPGDRHLMSIPMEPVFAGRSGWRRIYPDLPGMGATKGPDWISDQAGMLEATLRFMDAVAPNERFAVAGASYGGYLALGVLHERAERLDGLMLWAPMLKGIGKANAPEHQIFRHDPEVDDLLLEDEKAWLEISVVQTRETLMAFRAAVKPGLMAADREFLRRVAKGFEFTFDPLAIDPPFAGPSLFLVGRQDNAVGYVDLVALSASFPRATLAVLDQAGHGVAEEQRTVFRALVESWLDRMEAESA
jgi:pimeloyl-ACP methyl ester carboxylesterase